MAAMIRRAEEAPLIQKTNLNTSAKGYRSPKLAMSGPSTVDGSCLSEATLSARIIILMTGWQKRPDLWLFTIISADGKLAKLLQVMV